MNSAPNNCSEQKLLMFRDPFNGKGDFTRLHLAALRIRRNILKRLLDSIDKKATETNETDSIFAKETSVETALPRSRRKTTN